MEVEGEENGLICSHLPIFPQGVPHTPQNLRIHALMILCTHWQVRWTEGSGGGGEATVGNDVMVIRSCGCGFVVVPSCALICDLLTSKVRHGYSWGEGEGGREGGREGEGEGGRENC